MNRRNFLSAIPALPLVALPSLAQEYPEWPTEWTKEGRICHVLKRTPGGWRRIHRKDVKKGDRLLLLGLEFETGDLFRLTYFVAQKDGFVNSDGEHCVETDPKSVRDFLDELP